LKNENLWDLLFFISLGIITVLIVPVAGVLVIFSFLIIPAVFALIFTTSWIRRLFIGWGAGFIAIILGLIFSYKFDFSCGPSIISVLGVLLIIGVLIRKAIQKKTV